MDCQDVKSLDRNRERELWEFVNLRFVCAPIVLVEPVVDESLDFPDRRAVYSSMNGGGG